jgi:hypothetical protein
VNPHDEKQPRSLWSLLTSRLVQVSFVLLSLTFASAQVAPTAVLSNAFGLSWVPSFQGAPILAAFAERGLWAWSSGEGLELELAARGDVAWGVGSAAVPSVGAGLLIASEFDRGRAVRLAAGSNLTLAFIEGAGLREQRLLVSFFASTAVEVAEGVRARIELSAVPEFGAFGLAWGLEWRSW